VSELRELRNSAANGSVKQRDEAPVTLFFDDGTAYRHQGVVLFSEATVDQTTGQVTLRGQFPNPEGDLLPGLYVRVQVEQGIQPDAVAIPQQAVQRDPGGAAVVYVIAEDGTPQRRPVKLGRILGTRWVVEDGLKPGEKVMVEGFQKLRPGMKVQPQEWAPVSAGATPGKQAAANSGDTQIK
jgi:membrane fusion protein (multidrug efflux system)